MNKIDIINYYKIISLNVELLKEKKDAEVIPLLFYF